MKKVLILGGRGRIGQRVAQDLFQQVSATTPNLYR